MIFWPYKITLAFCIEDELEIDDHDDDMYLSIWMYNVLYALWKFFSYNFLLNRIICTFILLVCLLIQTCSQNKMMTKKKTLPCYVAILLFFRKVVFIAQVSTSIYRFFMNSLFLHDCHSHDTHIINIYTVEIVCPFCTVKWKRMFISLKESTVLLESNNALFTF